MNEIIIPWPEWDIKRRIGNGSFGSVYEIERIDQFGNAEKAALKIISIPKEESDIDSLYNSGYDDKSITEYFQTSLNSLVNEYVLMSQLKSHPNIVSVEDRQVIRQENGIGWDVYIRMELLIPFGKSVRGREVSEQEVIKLGKDLLNALKACHAKNIIHRDIKPENIFVNEFGDYKIGDFGIARIMSHTTNATKTGTPYYMAPEVSKDEKYGKEADIYSLGMVMYWLLNNKKLPFEPVDHLPNPNEKENAKKERLSGKEVPAPIRGSDGLKAIIKKALAYDPKDRYRSAEEMLNDLLHLEHLQIVQSEKQSQSEIDESKQTNTAADDQNEKTVDSNEPDVINSSTQPEETIDDNSWESGKGTISIIPDKSNKRSEITNESENKTDIDQTGEYESPTISVSGGSQNNVPGNNQMFVDIHSDDALNEKRDNTQKTSVTSENGIEKAYNTDQTSREKQIATSKPSTVENKKQDRWKKYLLFGLIPLVIFIFLISSRTKEQSQEDEMPVAENDDEPIDDFSNINERNSDEKETVASGTYEYVQEESVTWNNIIDIAAGGHHTIGINKGGKIIYTGSRFDHMNEVENWKDIKAIYAGFDYAAGLMADGTVVAAGVDFYNNECDVSDWKDIKVIAAGYEHTVGLKSDGTVVATGWNIYGQCDVSEWNDIVAIAAGFDHTIGLKKDGTVVATGHNSYGQCDVTEWEGITEISAGQHFSIGLKADGTVVAAGKNQWGECNVSDWEDITSISAGGTYTVGLKADGTVVATGCNDYGQCNVSDWKNIDKVSAGWAHTVGLKEDGTVIAIGYNEYGQCNLTSEY